MNAGEIIAALDLPASARVDQRVPKKLLVENGAPTSADKRRINDGIEEFRWLAALKPGTIGVPLFRNATREYLEIAVLSVALRADAKGERLAELIHRAVPYPIFLIALQGDALALSLVHKRWSQGEAGKTVLDGELVAVNLRDGLEAGHVRRFLEVLPLVLQPRTTLFALYQSWMDKFVALQAAELTGTFEAPVSSEQASVRHEALQECERLETRMTALQSAAAKEKQLSRQVELNLELQRVRTAHAAAKARLLLTRTR